MEILLKRGTSTALDSYNGKPGEVAIDTDNNHIRLFNGNTNGGLVIANKDDIPTKLSQLQNDSNFITSTNVSNPSAYVTKVYRSGHSWYRIWSDGFIEQHNRYNGYTGERNATINFLIPFTEVPNVLKTYITTSTANGFLCKAVGLYALPTTTSFEVNYVYGETDRFHWYASGY